MAQLQLSSPSYMKRYCCYLVVFFSLAFAFKGSAADTTVIKSPDAKIVFKLFQKDRQLYFTISSSGKLVLAPSPLYLSVDGIPVTSNMKAGKVERYTRNSTYAVHGVHAKAVDHCNGAVVHFTAGGGSLQVILEARVFNNGVAYRHNILSEKPELAPGENTVFNLPTGSNVWYHDLYMHYEGVHIKRQVDSVKEGEWLAPPVTFKLPRGGYASITEADLTGYPGMALESNGKNGLAIRLAHEQPTSYPYKLRYNPQDTLRLKQPASIRGTMITPWRVVIIGKDLNTLVNSDIITNLNPPPDPKLFPSGNNTSWIKPGRAVWKYLNGGGDGTPEVMKRFTDGAAALGFEHNILEGFWTRWTDDQLKDLVQYSKQKNVGIWLWKHSKSLRNPSSRDSFFAKCNALGITGAKIDFFDHEAKEVIDLYEAILKESAKYHVLVDFHGANKPTGLSRTYPNALVYEGVKGMEASKLTDRATHETTIPFTRLLAGPAEYTVVHLGERRKNTTWAHQLASAAILSAPLLTYAANPDTLLMNPAVNIIKSIPAIWDETIVLPPSEIGELAVYARRKGNTWFLAVMNGVQAKTIRVPLTFLNGNYNAAVAKDDPANSASVIVEQKKYSSKDVLLLDLVPGGGFIAQFSK
jgi:alpha-glucosidase